MPDTDTDDGPEWRRTSGQPTLDMSRSVSDMTNAELRAKIAQRTGHRPPRSALTKPIWNSLHAWFTGDFYLKPAALRPGVPPKPELVAEVVLKAVNAYEEHPVHEDVSEGALEDMDDHPVFPLVSWYVDVKDAETVPAMNKDELRKFIAAMDTSGDQRHWTDHD